LPYNSYSYSPPPFYSTSLPIQLCAKGLRGCK
jgi:hypothetical protein